MTNYYTEIEFKKIGSNVRYILPLLIISESYDDALEIFYRLRTKIELKYRIESHEKLKKQYTTLNYNNFFNRYHNQLNKNKVKILQIKEWVEIKEDGSSVSVKFTENLIPGNQSNNSEVVYKQIETGNFPVAVIGSENYNNEDLEYLIIEIPLITEE